MEINNCPTCGGKIEFSPDDKGLKCEKCANVYPIIYKQPKDKKRLIEGMLNQNDEGFKKWKDSKRAYSCQNCGAEIILNQYDMTTKCSYCNTSSLVPIEKLPGLKPDAIIPFKISKSKANEQFKINTKKRMFLPSDFKKSLPKTKIGATYLSSFSFGIDAFATYHGIRAVSRTVMTKNGARIITDYVPFSGSIAHTFDNIIVECSEKIAQSQINSIMPYHFKESYDYNDDFLTGYSVEYYNQTITDASKIADDEALKSLDSMIRRKHSGVRSLTINPKYSNVKYTYVLLPLYFINYKYKDKEYLNLMNGQTGQSAGKVPRSPTKITFFTLMIILLVVGLPLLIVLLSSL